MLILPFFPLATVLVGMFSITYVRCDEFECTDIMQDPLDCDACCCCTVCHDHEDDHDDDDPNLYYDDSSDSFHAHYAKKS